VTTQAYLYKEDDSLKLPPARTGWPASPLAQDDHRGLFRWFASKPDARLRVREALAAPHGEGKTNAKQP
jgi:hypothetical protein